MSKYLLDKNPNFKSSFADIVSEYKLDSQKKLSDAQALTFVREQLFLEELEGVLKRTMGKLPAPKRLKPVKKAEPKRILNLLISDTHYRSMLDTKEVNCQYGPVEESRRTAAVFTQACDYKSQYRNETTLKIHILGDIIQNQLHDTRDGQPLAEQSAAAISNLFQAIRFASMHFPKVEVHCTPGNHGRNTSRHHGRAVHQKWDSIETIVYYGLKCALGSIRNVRVEIPRTPYYTVDLFDNKGFFTHGDTVLSAGYPGGAINVKSLRGQINEWNNSRNAGGPFALFAVGHVHTGAIVNLPGGVTLVTNGCLCPSDSYSMSLGSPDISSGQYLIESVQGHAVGDTRFIRVDSEVDRDSSFDTIVKPFTDF
jgi:hypothetical protein